MTEKNPYLAEAFPEPPLVAFRRQTFFKDYLIRSKITIKHNSESQKDKRGIKKCVERMSCLPINKCRKRNKTRKVHMEN